MPIQTLFRKSSARGSSAVIAYVEPMKRRLLVTLAAVLLTVLHLHVLAPGGAFAEGGMKAPPGASPVRQAGCGTAVRGDTGFNANSLAAGDDTSVQTALGFTINYYGTNYTQVHVNTNGSITFDAPLAAFTGFPPILGGQKILAPFLADADTRNVSSQLVKYGTSTIDGHVAFGVNWSGVGFHPSRADKLNTFQLVLIERADKGAGAFDIEFNYGTVQWESGDASGGIDGLGGFAARAGYSNGSGTVVELPNSGVAGSFPNTLCGRYPFQVRGGEVGAVELYLLYVADTTNHRVQKFDGSAWTVILGTGSPGIGANQLSSPEAVTANANNSRLYVADTANNRIQWSSDAGLTWGTFASSGIGLNQVSGPQGLALDAQGNLYVADTTNNRVMRFNGGVPGNGVVVASFGSLAGQVRSPRGLAIDASNRLFIADRDNNRVLRVLNANTVTTANTGTVVASGPGFSLTQVSAPQGVAVDNAGDLYVADTSNNRVLKFAGGNPGTATLMTTGSGFALGQASAPEGVAISSFPTGTFAGSSLMVGDTNNNRIQGKVLPSGSWALVGSPNGLGSGVGQFNKPSKMR